MIDTPRNLARAAKAFCAQPRDTRPALEYVQLERTAGTVHAHATNGDGLLRLSWESNAPDAGPYYVHAATLARAEKLADKGDRIAVDEHRNALVLRGHLDDAPTVVRDHNSDPETHDDPDYPDCNRVIPGSIDLATEPVRIGYLLGRTFDALAALEPGAKRRGGAGLDIELNSAWSPSRFSARIQGDAFPEIMFEAYVMPMRR